jgi:hypothetical protein
VTLGLLLVAPEASALELTFTGGMGLTVWPMNLRVTELDHSGVGVGISGRVMMRLGQYVRFQAGLLQGSFSEDDRSRVRRSGIFGSVEAFYHLHAPFYTSLGLKVAADHLRLTETLELLDDSTRLVNDVDRWTPMIEPFLTLGVLLGGRFHLELETGMIVAFFDGEVYLSAAVVLGVYFRMGGRH